MDSQQGSLGGQWPPLRRFNTPEEIRRATMHTTNKAFERYFQVELEDVRRVYQNTREPAPKLHHDIGARKKS